MGLSILQRNYLITLVVLLLLGVLLAWITGLGDGQHRAVRAGARPDRIVAGVLGGTHAGCLWWTDLHANDAEPGWIIDVHAYIWLRRFRDAFAVPVQGRPRSDTESGTSVEGSGRAADRVLRPIAHIGRDKPGHSRMAHA